MVDVIVLLIFYFVLFGIMTVQLFGGVLRNRCGYPTFENATTDALGFVQVCLYLCSSTAECSKCSESVWFISKFKVSCMHAQHPNKYPFTLLFNRTSITSCRTVRR